MYALVVDDTPYQLKPGSPFTDANEIQHPANVLDIWPIEELASIGVLPINDDPIPDGKIATGSELEIAGNSVIRHWTLQDAPPPPVPPIISDRQFAQVLAVQGVITEDEALAWAARGDLPATLETAVMSLPEDQRFGARMLLSSATTYERNHPLVGALGSMLGYDSDQMDDFWRAAAAL